MKEKLVRCLIGLGVCSSLMFCGCFSDKDELGEGSDLLEFDDMGNPLVVEDGMALGPRGTIGPEVMGVDFASVSFPFDSFQIADSERATIETVAAYLARTSGVIVVCDGHCDERGSREYNLSLGELRASAVRAYLIGLGVDASRIQTRSFGEEQPLAPEHDESSWRMNRRVEFSIHQ